MKSLKISEPPPPYVYHLPKSTGVLKNLPEFTSKICYYYQRQLSRSFYCYNYLENFSTIIRGKPIKKTSLVFERWFQEKMSKFKYAYDRDSFWCIEKNKRHGRIFPFGFHYHFSKGGANNITWITYPITSLIGAPHLEVHAPLSG